jgi:hypothetical protein
LNNANPARAHPEHCQSCTLSIVHRGHVYLRRQIEALILHLLREGIACMDQIRSERCLQS